MVEFVASVTVGVYLLILLGIGIWSSRLAGRSERDYWIAGGKTPFWVNLPAVLAIFISGGSFLGVAGLAYGLGALIPTYFIAGALAGSVLLVVLVSNQYRRSGALTFPDYMTYIFQDTRVRAVSALMFGLYALGYLVPQLLGGGVTFSYLLGTDPDISIGIMAVAVVIYVSVGGFWAVTWTDFLQGIVLYIMMLAVGIIALIDLGGPVELWQTAVSTSEVYGEANFELWLSGFGLFITWVFAWLTFPAIVSRAFSSATPRVASRSMALGTALYAIFHFFTIFVVGAAALALSGTGLDNPDMAFIIVMDEYLPSVIAGIAAAGILSALMSSADSLLLGAVAAIVHDVYKELFNPDLSDARTVRLSRIVTLVLGIIVVVFTLNTPAIIGVIAGQVAGFAAAALFFPMAIGTWWMQTTSRGVNYGMLSGGVLFVVLTVAAGLPEFTPVLLATTVSALVTIGVSWFGDDPTEERIAAFKSVHNVK